MTRCLIAAAVVAFGPVTGFAYSWVGTMVSSLVGFSLGQVPSAANGFQAISTDGLSERNGVGQAFMAATQGSASADPFAPATPITPVF